MILLIIQQLVYYTELYYTVLYCTVLHSAVLNYTILYYYGTAPTKTYHIIVGYCDYYIEHYIELLAI